MDLRSYLNRLNQLIQGKQGNELSNTLSLICMEHVNKYSCIHGIMMGMVCQQDMHVPSLLKPLITIVHNAFLQFPGILCLCLCNMYVVCPLWRLKNIFAIYNYTIFLFL